MLPDPVIVGGASHVGAALRRELARLGGSCVVFDRRTPTASGPAVHADLLVDDVALPPGPVVLALGLSRTPPLRAWQAVEVALATARLLPALAGRRVLLLTPARTVEPPLDVVLPWVDPVLRCAAEPCPAARVAPLGAALAGATGDAQLLASAVQELLVTSVVPADLLTVVRVGELFGPGLPGPLEELVHRALAGLSPRPGTVGPLLHVDDLAAALAADPPPGVLFAGLGPLPAPADLVHDELARCGVLPAGPLPAPTDVPDAPALLALLGCAEPAGVRLERQLRAAVRARAWSPLPPLAESVPVVLPPRPERPDLVAQRCATALQTGVLRHGGPWTGRLEGRLHEELALGDDRVVLVTGSGTAALRLGTVALAGPARPGDVAVLPSYTFAATAEVLRELGFRLRFCDIDPGTWTMDPDALRRALAPGDVRLVVSVDALGCPADLVALQAVAAGAGVPLLADSAPSLGGRVAGVPVGGQADAHAFSMSFAKVVSAGGAGGALVLRAEQVDRLRAPVDWTRAALMTEPSAVVALDLLDRLEELRRRRGEVAAVYEELLAGVPGVRAQSPRPGDRHALVHWAARVPGRDALVVALAAQGVGTRAYYTPALHRHDWAGGAEPVRLPETERLVDEVLALPMSSELTRQRAEEVAVRVRETLLAQGARERLEAVTA